jgi:hypothetical protein
MLKIVSGYLYNSLLKNFFFNSNQKRSISRGKKILLIAMFSDQGSECEFDYVFLLFYKIFN